MQNDNIQANSWANSYLLNIPDIDAQHKKFFEILGNASRYTDADEYNELFLIIQELEKYLSEHFAFEEELMQKVGFKDIDNHIIQHQHFINKVKQLKLEFDYQNPQLYSKIIEFMKKWFVSHIIQSDTKYKNAVETFLNK
jgi:hemerythrin